MGKRFQSLVSAKVVLDESGFSKGFGFIRFHGEVEQQTAMTSMNGMSGLGGKPIKVSVAVNKIKDGQNGGGQYGGGGHVPDHIKRGYVTSDSKNKPASGVADFTA